MRRTGVVLFSLFISACSHYSPRGIVEGGDNARTELSGELLYHLLAGEFAGVRGQIDQSADFYLEAAKESGDPQIAARAAHIALFAKHYEQALEACEHWQALGGDATEIERIKVVIYLNLDDQPRAIESIEKVIMVNGHVDGQSVGALGEILRKEASEATSLSILEILNQKHPDNFRLLLLQGRYEANAGHFDKASQSIDRVIALEPNISDAYLIRAQIYASQDKGEEALQAVAMAVEKRPGDDRLRQQYARMLTQMKHFGEARDQFLQLHRTMPGDEHVLLSLGLISIELAEYDDAKQFLQELIDNGYYNAQAHYYLGRIQQSQGEIMAALANYERVGPGEYYLDAGIRAAGLHAQLGKVDEALKKLQELSQGQTGNNLIKLYLARGEVLRNAQRNQEALKLYNMALEGAPENTDLLYGRALTAEKLDMLEMTESDLRMILMHEPDNANALNALGYTLADRTGRLQEAKDYILKAMQLVPDDPAILDSLGWVYYRLGQHEEAIKWLRKAFAALEDAEIAAHLGEVLWVTGKTQEAREIWQRGLKVKPDHPLLLNTIKRYQK
ncbi:MAG: tetratricopeptide repeat protein [Gammaproteobacteria bacterium]|nr:MAG: tetratricopeptide repeat protein [Gammaproteobacteria bacterium]